jgi:hypothetical protein
VLFISVNDMSRPADAGRISPALGGRRDRLLHHPQQAVIDRPEPGEQPEYGRRWSSVLPCLGLPGLLALLTRPACGKAPLAIMA